MAEAKAWHRVPHEKDEETEKEWGEKKKEKSMLTSTRAYVRDKLQC